MHSRSKLSEGDAVEIRRAYASGARTQQSIADEYGVTKGRVSQIVNGRSRRQSGADAERGVGAHAASLERSLTDEDLVAMRASRSSGKSAADVAAAFCVGVDIVQLVCEPHGWGDARR